MEEAFLVARQGCPVRTVQGYVINALYSPNLGASFLDASVLILYSVCSAFFLPGNLSLASAHSSHTFSSASSTSQEGGGIFTICEYVARPQDIKFKPKKREGGHGNGSRSSETRLYVVRLVVKGFVM